MNRGIEQDQGIERLAAELDKSPTEIERALRNLESKGLIATNVSEGLERLAEKYVLEVNEYDDRTSPEDWPEALLITSDELHDLLKRFAAETATLEAAGEKLSFSIASDGAQVAIAALRRALSDCAQVPMWQRDHFLANRIEEAIATLSPPLPSPGVERLREALQVIADRPGAGMGYAKCGGEFPIDEAANMANIARAALSALPLDGGLSSD